MKPDPYLRPSQTITIGQCADCGARLWVSPQSTDPHCTSCHMRRLGLAR